MLLVRRSRGPTSFAVLMRRVLRATSVPLLVLVPALGCSAFSSGPPRATITPRPPLVDLLVTADDLPEDWWSRWPPTDDSRHFPMADEAVLAQFESRRGRGLAHHLLLRYVRASLADEEFEHEGRGWQSYSGDLIRPWAAPAAMDYRSPIADDFSCACMTRETDDIWEPAGDLCVAVARYGEYISVFSTWMSPRYMTYSDLQRVLRTIDARMARHLGKTQSEAPRTPTLEP